MTPKKNKTILEHVLNFVKILGILSVIGGAVALFVGWGEVKKDYDTRLFESVEQRIKTQNHINSDYNEVRNYQLMEEQKEMKIQLDTSFAYVNALFKEDRARLKLDSVNSANAIKSRHVRDSLNAKVIFDINNIKRDQTIQTNTNQLILQELRKLKEMIDTIN